jgi:hypothetical protein
MLYARKETPAMRAAAQMPPLPHFPMDGSRFDVNKSEVIKWLLALDEVKQDVFNQMKMHGAITFDLESRCWHGVEWHPKQSAPSEKASNQP